jgi:hypothetical protein
MNELILLQNIIAVLSIMCALVFIFDTSFSKKYEGKRNNILWAYSSICWCVVFLLELNS